MIAKDRQQMRLVGEAIGFVTDVVDGEKCDGSLLRAQQDGFQIDGCIQQSQSFSVFRGANQAGVEVILKCPNTDTEQTDHCISQLADEHASLASIQHDAVVQSIGYVPGENGYLATVFEGDRDLLEWIKASRPKREDLINLLSRVVMAVSAIHDAGLVHGDLKPQHVVIREDGSPVLIDFGLAERWRDINRCIKLSHRIGGTSHYMAPEVAERRVNRPDPRQDVHALGHILREAFEAANLSPGKLAKIISQATAADPANRPSDAATMLATMQAALKPRRWPVAVAAAALCLCLSGVLFFALSGPAPPFSIEQPDSLPMGEGPYGQSEFIHAARFDPSSGVLAWADQSGDVFTRVAEEGEVNQTRLPAQPRDITFSSRMVGFTCMDGTVQLLTHDLEPLKELELEQSIRAAKLSPEQHAVYCWVPSTSAFVTVPLDGSPQHSLAVEADYVLWDDTNTDHAIAVMGGGIALVDLMAGKVQHIEFDNQAAVTAADYDEKSGTIALGTADGQTHYFDGKNWTALSLQAASPVVAIHTDGYAAIAGQVMALDWKRQRIVGRFGKPTSGAGMMQLIVEDQSVTTVSSLGVRRWQTEPSR